MDRFDFGAQAPVASYGYVTTGKDGLAHGWAPWQRGDSKEVSITLRRAAEVAGTVVDGDGVAITGAEVRGELRSDESEYESIGDESRPAVIGWLTAVTDPQGRFVLKALPEGARMRLRVTAPGYAEVYVSNRFASDYMAGQYPIRPPRTGLHISLPPEAAISGVVVDKDTGRPLGGVHLQLSAFDRSGGDLAIIEPVTGVMSGDDGTFRIGGLGNGLYRLGADVPEDRGGLIVEDQMITAAAGREITSLRIEAARAATLEVRVVDEVTGAAADGALVSYSRVGSETSCSSSTDGGAWTLQLFPGDYRVSARSGGAYVSDAEESATKVELKGGETARIELKIRTGGASPKEHAPSMESSAARAALETTASAISDSEPAATIAGVAHDENGNPVPHAEVSLWSEFSMRETGASTRTDEGGRFELRTEPGNDYERRQLMIFSADRGLAAIVPVEQSDETVDAVLRKADTVAGRIVDPDGKAIPGATGKLVVRDRKGFAWDDRPVAENISTDGDGRYQIMTVLPMSGELRIEASAPKHSRVGMPVDASSSKDHRIDAGTIVLRPGNHTISGRVMGTDGEPIEGVTVCAGFGMKVVEMEGVEGIYEDQPLDAEGTSGPDGRFTVTGVTDGRARVFIWGREDELASAEADADSTDVKLVIDNSDWTPGTPMLGDETVDVTGNRLPSFDGFGVETALGDLTGKPVLVCLYDMDSRPSREVMKAIVEREKELRDKGIVVVCIDVAAADAASARAEAQKNGLPYVTGASKSGPGGTVEYWGGRGVPWLVLADKEHTVVAAGATLDGMKECLDRIGR